MSRQRPGLRARARSLAGVALGAAALPVSAALAAAQHPSHGPLTYEEGSPLQRISYTATMEEAELAPEGAVIASLGLGFSNIFEQDSAETHVLFLDLERLVTAVTVRWGVTGRVEVGGGVQLGSSGAGKLDGVILGWHDALGFGQANRDRFPEGRYAQRLTDGGDTVYMDVPRRGLGLEDVRLFAKALLARSADGRGVLSARTVARFPTAPAGATPERPDLALALLARSGRGSWYLHGMLGVSTVSAAPALDPILRGASTHVAVAVERSFGSVSALVQYQVQSAVLDAFDHRELDRAASNLVLGASGTVGSHWRWDASFQEDLPADTPAIDFTLGLRVSRRW